MMLFPQAVIRSAETYKPNTVADFVYELAGTYNTFQNKHRVLQAENEDLIASRLFLCSKTAELIKISLELLGIETVEQM
jgi:arginyl-tRNA synthetase